MFGAKERLSEERILTELHNVESSTICDRGAEAAYLIPSKPTLEGIKLCRAGGRDLTGTDGIVQAKKARLIAPLLAVVL